MKHSLTSFQKRLCNILQTGLPICWRPFAEVAKTLNSDGAEVLRQVRWLKKSGVIRRISALINYRALGMVSTLVAAHIPQQNLQEVVDAINRLEGVSHNYLRSHYYNLWFTLQANSNVKINVILTDLSGRFGIDFYSLPVKRVFKLDVRFDAESEQDVMLENVTDVPQSNFVELHKDQLKILAKLQNELKLVNEPFNTLCVEGLSKEGVLKIIKNMVKDGVIRRIAAVVDHHKLGFVANILFACELPQDGVIEMGRKLARYRAVSHCYERETFQGWPYNLFAMMHSRNMGQIQHIINKFTEAERIKSFQLLPTETELKKQLVKHKLL